MNEPKRNTLNQVTCSVPTKADVLKAIYESGVHQENPHMIKYHRRDGKIVEDPSAYAMNFAKRLAQNRENSHREHSEAN